MSNWEKNALQIATFIGLSSYPSAMLAFHNRLLDFGRRNVEFVVSDEIVDLVEDELDKFKSLLMKVNADIAVTDSMTPEWRGGFYLRNGFELLLPLRAVIKNISEIPRKNRVISIRKNGIFSNKVKSLDTSTTEAGKHIFDDYILSIPARRFIIRRELHRANNRRFILVPVCMWILLVSVVALIFKILMRRGRLISYSSLAVSIPLTLTVFKSSMKNFHQYGEMLLDHDTCADSPEYIEGARQYLKSSIATNLRIRKALGDTRSEFIAANGDRVGDQWPYSKRLKALENFATEEAKKK